MANMFSESRNKTMPKSVQDCIAPDAVSAGLWSWAEAVERYGKIILIVTIIFGVILSLSTLITDDVGTFFLSLFVVLPITALTAFVEYLIYHTIALLIGSQASITQNTAITANASLLSVRHNSDILEVATSSIHNNANEENTPIFTEFWTCYSCGTSNPTVRKDCVKCKTTKAWSDAKSTKK